jgi:hypothetical protein
MKRMFLTIIAAGMITGTTGIAFADDPPEGRIQERKENQQRRIGNGVKNGTLSPKETVNLEKKEGALNKEIHHDRVQNGGNLTNKEKAQINRQQNRLSRQIYKAKHDGPGK